MIRKNANRYCVTVLVEDRRWNRSPGLASAVRQAAGHALGHVGAPGASAVSVLLTDNETVRVLNARFRKRNKPTNVLSFPASAHGDSQGDYLGDIALAYGVTAAEARTARKKLASHAAHLAVHGVLHLLGYDHIRLRDARIMEPLETEILAAMGIADPYSAIMIA
jgi:probable rRNA maturation factor